MQLMINGEYVDVPKQWRDSNLLSFIREYLGLTGSKFGCGKGQCGACTVVIGDQAVRSCLLPLSGLAGYRVTTIEGLAKGDELHPLQTAWLEHAVAQCGYCQAGQIMTACALLKRNPSPDKTQIIQALDGNLCRCGTYQRITAAVSSAAQKLPLYTEVD